MTDHADLLDAFIDQYLQHLDGTAAQPRLSDLPPPAQDEARARLTILESVWGTGVEVPEVDPVAQRFGFDRAGQTVIIDGRRARTQRQTAGLSLEQLHQLMTNAGATITSGELLRLEQNAHVEIPQATGTALVAALESSLTDLETATPTKPSTLSEFLDSDAFAELINSWATEHGRDHDITREAVADRVLAAQFRADEVTAAQLIEIVEAILNSLEP